MTTLTETYTKTDSEKRRAVQSVIVSSLSSMKEGVKMIPSLRNLIDKKREKKNEVLAGDYIKMNGRGR